MNFFSSLIQYFFDMQLAKQKEKMREMGLRAAEKGRKFAISLILYWMATALVYSSLVLGVIELGLQIERGNGLSFSGLMVSACILFVLGFVFMMVGLRIGTGPVIVKNETSESSTEWESAARGADSAACNFQIPDEVKNLLEEITLHYLREFADKIKGGKSKKSTADSSSPAEPTNS